MVCPDTMPKIFNLDQCDKNKPHLILEGPIDAMFLDNAVAMAGGSVNEEFLTENSILVFDNEPRSRHTCARIQKAIDKGQTISLFPTNIDQKDVNDMILSGIDAKKINQILYDNASSGATAQLKFNLWKKV